MNSSLVRYVCLIIVTVVSYPAKGQLTLQKDFPLEDIRYFFVSDTEGVYVNYSSYSGIRSLHLYDDAMQVIRTVDAIEDTILNVINVSKYLCNDDDLYEIIYTYHTFKGGTSHYNTHIIDENSGLLASLEDQYLWIQNTSAGPKLLSQQGSRVYSLPGIHYPVLKGKQGEPGPQGPPGQAGGKGEKGDPGPQGEQGPQGPQGSQGLKGAKGDPYQEVYYAECDCQLYSLNLPLDESIFLSEPYPNPAYETSTIDYDIVSISTNVNLEIFDMTGTKRLSLQLRPPRGYVEIHKSLLGSGIYFMRIEYESGCSEIRKLEFE